MGPEDINARYINLKEKFEALDKEIALRDSNDPSLINMRSEVALLRNEIRKEREFRNNVAELSSKYTEYEAFYNRMQELYDALGELNNEASRLSAFGPIPQELQDSIRDYEKLINELLANSSITDDIYKIPEILKDLAFKINKLNGIIDPEVAKEDLEKEKKLAEEVQLLQEEKDARSEKARIQRKYNQLHSQLDSIPKNIINAQGFKEPNPEYVNTREKLDELNGTLTDADAKLTLIHDRNISLGLDYRKDYTRKNNELNTLRNTYCTKYEKQTIEETRKYLSEILANNKAKDKENSKNNPPLGTGKPAPGPEPSSGKPAPGPEPSSGKPAQGGVGGGAQGGKKTPTTNNLGGKASNPSPKNNPSLSDSSQNQEPKITMNATDNIYMDLLNFPQKPCTTNSTFSYIKRENIAGEAKLVYETEDIQKYLNDPRKHLKKLIKELRKDETLMKFTKEKDATLYKKLSKPRKLLRDIDHQLTHDMQIHNFVALKSAVTPEQVADALNGKYPYDYKINYTKTTIRNPFSSLFREIRGLDEYKRTAVDLHPVAKKESIFDRTNSEKEKAVEKVPLRPKLKGRDDFDR
jgi:hypothetical protein